MYSFNLPQITEKIMWGGDTIHFNVLDISTTDSDGHTMEQREIRLGISPIEFSITRRYKHSTNIGIGIKQFKLNTEFVYGKPAIR